MRVIVVSLCLFGVRRKGKLETKKWESFVSVTACRQPNAECVFEPTTGKQHSDAVLGIILIIKGVPDLHHVTRILVSLCETLRPLLVVGVPSCDYFLTKLCTRKVYSLGIISNLFHLLYFSKFNMLLFTDYNSLHKRVFVRMCECVRQFVSTRPPFEPRQL